MTQQGLKGGSSGNPCKCRPSFFKFFCQLSESTGVGSLSCVRTAHCLVLYTPEDSLPHGGRWWRQGTSSYWFPGHLEMSEVIHEVGDLFRSGENVCSWTELESSSTLGSSTLSPSDSSLLLHWSQHILPSFWLHGV